MKLHRATCAVAGPVAGNQPPSLNLALQDFTHESCTSRSSWPSKRAQRIFTRSYGTGPTVGVIGRGAHWPRRSHRAQSSGAVSRCLQVRHCGASARGRGPGGGLCWPLEPRVWGATGPAHAARRFHGGGPHTGMRVPPCAGHACAEDTAPPTGSALGRDGRHTGGQAPRQLT